jgi:diguanylate cyclase (GGDEF)-like protein/PAS domain S-box-containing protein
MLLESVRSRFHFLAGSVPDIMWSALSDGWPDYYNQRWWDYTGLPLGLEGWIWEHVIHPDDRDAAFSTWSQAVERGVPFEFECRLRRAHDGAYRWHRARAVPMCDEHGAIEIWVGTATDIDDYRQTLEALGQARDALEARVAVRTAELATANETLRAEIDERLHVEQALRASIVEREHAEETLATVLAERTEMLHIVEHQALHDALTCLPNRTLLYDRVEQAVRDAQRNSGTLALLLLDLDGFKEVNDTLGHHMGDLLLKDLAARLLQSLRDADTVARIGGDEFAVLLPDADEDGARQVAEKIAESIERPFATEGHAISVKISIGVALYPEHGTALDLLMRHADIAMYHAKRHDRRVDVFTGAPSPEE